MPDVLLVVAPKDNNEPNLERRNENLGTGYLASILRSKGFRVEILDSNIHRLSKEQVFDIIKSQEIQVIGFSVRQEAIENAIWLARELKKNNHPAKIVFGGYCPTLMGDKILNEVPEVDVIVRGEGEYTLLELVQKINKKEDWQQIKGISFNRNGEIINTPPRELIQNLDDIPFPARDTLPYVLNSGGTAYIITSRGCYANCPFCCMKAFYSKGKGKSYRYRSAKNIADELEYLAKSWNIKEAWISDDNFIGPGQKGKERIEEFINELMVRKLKIRFKIMCRVNDVEMGLFGKLKQVGLDTVELGVENVNLNVLKQLKKNITFQQSINAIEILDNLKIHCNINLILFNPDTTVSEFKNNYQFFAKRIKKGRINESVKIIYFYLFSKLHIYPGIQIEQEFISKFNLKKHGYHNNYEITNSDTNKIYKLGLFLGVITGRICEMLDMFDRKIEQDQNKIYQKITEELWLQFGKILLLFNERLIDYIENNLLSKEEIQKEFLIEFYSKLSHLKTKINTLATEILEDFFVPKVHFYTYRENGSQILYDRNSSNKYPVDNLGLETIKMHQAINGQSTTTSTLDSMDSKEPSDSNVNNVNLLIREGKFINPLKPIDLMPLADAEKMFKLFIRFPYIQFNNKYT